MKNRRIAWGIGALILAVLLGPILVQAITSGTKGATSPSEAVQSGGRDGANKLQPVAVNTRGYVAYYPAPFAPVYSASFSFAPGTGGTSVAALIGSASKVVYIKKVCLSGTATATASELVQLILKSAISTGPTPVFLTPVSNITAEPTPMALVWTWPSTPGPPTPGATRGILRTWYQTLNIAATTSLEMQPVCFDFTGEEPVLNGASQILEIVMDGAVPAGTNITGTIEWME